MKITVFRDATLIHELDFSDFIIVGEISEFNIGRSDDAHIHLSDQQISRELATLRYDGTSWNLIKKSEYDIVLVNNIS